MRRAISATTTRWFARIVAICVVSAIAISMLPLDAGASTPIVGLSAPATVASGGTVNLVATAPVVDATTNQETIVQKIDPSVVQLSSTSQIIAPAGWTVEYSTNNGTSFTTTAPTTTAGWAAVDEVEAIGSITSNGADANGNQLMSASSSASVSSYPAAFSSGAGDGWDVAFDNAGHVFTMPHHTNSQLSCHNLNGTVCAGSWPYTTPQNAGSMNSLLDNEQAPEWVNNTTHKVWFPTEVHFATGNSFYGGFGCIDISNLSSPQVCGNGATPTGFVKTNTPSSGGGPDWGFLDWVHEFAVVGSKIYAQDVATGDLICVDTNANNGLGAPCAGQPYAITGMSSTCDYNHPCDGNTSDTPQLFAWNGQIWGTNGGNKLFCFDPTTSTLCSGWSSAITVSSVNGSSGVYLQPDATGAVQGICVIPSTTSSPTYCFNQSGASITVNSGLATSVSTTLLDGSTMYSKVPLTIGTDVVEAAPYGSKLVCFNVATDAACTGWPLTGSLSGTSVSTLSPYSLTQDPSNPSCLWENGNDGEIVTVDLQGNSPCASKANFSASALAPQLSCAAGSGPSSWSSFTLTAPTLGGTGAPTAATLSVSDSNGNPISGWQNVTVQTGTALSLSTLPVSTTGPQPQFSVRFTGATSSFTATAKVISVGDQPQLCTNPIATYTCPSGTGPIPTLTNQSTTVTASASAVDAGTTVNMTPTSLTISVTTPSSSSCESSISGVASRQGGGAIAGATATLTTSNGTVVDWPSGFPQAGQPVTTTTGADGSYSFSDLGPGTYSVQFADLSSSVTVASATTVSGASGSTTGTTSAASGVVLADPVAVAIGTPGVVNALYVQSMSVEPATSIGVTGQTQTLTPLTGDTASSGGTLTASSVKLCSGSQVSPNCTATSLAVAGQGTYAVNADGSVTFTPCSAANTPAGASCTGAFTGTATPVAYQVSDSNGEVGTSTLTPTVDPPPTANPLAQTGPDNTAQTYDALSDISTPSGTTVADSSLKLCSTGQSAPNCTATSVTIAGQGTYSVDPTTGVVTFTPLSTFTGTATPVSFQATNSLGATTSSTITPTVLAVPTATPDTTNGAQGAAQSSSVLANDSSGLLANSLKLCSTGQSAPNCTATSVTIAGEGTYSANPATGVVTFTPLSTFTGTANPVTYQAQDLAGQTASSTYTPTVVPPPMANPLAQTGPRNTAQTYDTFGAISTPAGTTVAASTIALCDPTTNPAQSAPNCTATSVTIPSEGTYVVNADGTVTFTPVPSFAGTATSVTYQGTNNLGVAASSTITPTVLAVPYASPDTSSGSQGVPQSMSVLANDWGGLVPTSVKLCDPTTNPAQSAPNCTATSVTIAGQGTYGVDPTTGVVTFTPLSTFTGTATPVTYQALGPSNEVATSTYTPTVIPLPSASPLSKVGPANTPQSFNVMNSVTTPPGTSILSSSLKLCDPTTTPAQTVPNCSATTVTIPGEGTYAVHADGTVTFTPIFGFTGSAMPITYQVTNSIGGVASSTISPDFDPPTPAAVVQSTSASVGLASTGLKFMSLIELALGLVVVGTTTTVIVRWGRGRPLP